MHYLDGVVCIFLAFELDESISLVLVCDLIAGYVHIHHGPTLCEEFPEDVLIDLLVEVAAVDGGLLVALVERRDCSHTLIIMH